MKNVYHILFRLTCQKNATIAYLWKREEGGGSHWEVQFRKPFQDWELEEGTYFFGHISSFQLHEEEDILIWKGERRENFNIKSSLILLVCVVQTFKLFLSI